MKRCCIKQSCGWLAFLAMFAVGLPAQEKARVYVEGQASISASGKRLGILGSKSENPSEDAAEFGKMLEQDCSSVAVLPKKDDADYTLTVTSASSKKDRDLRASGQVRVANRAGKSVGTNFLQTSGNAAKDACELIEADWKQGKAQASGAAPDTALVERVATPPAATDSAVPGTVSVSPRLQTGSSTGVAAGGSGNAGEDLGAASRLAKQHAECLKLARQNPSITCK